MCSWRCGRRQTWYHWVEGVQEIGKPPPPPAGRGGWAAGAWRRGPCQRLASWRPYRPLLDRRHHGHLGLPSPQDLTSFLCPQQHLALLTIPIWTPLGGTSWLSRLLLPTSAQPWAPRVILSGHSSAFSGATQPVPTDLSQGSTGDLSTVFQVTAFTLGPLPRPQRQPALTPGPRGQLSPAALCVSVTWTLQLSTVTAERLISPSLWGRQHDPWWPGFRQPCPVLATVWGLAGRPHQMKK